MKAFWRRRLPAVLLVLTLTMSLAPAAAAAEHTVHTPSTAWASSATEHWRICQEGGEAINTSRAAHTLTGWVSKDGSVHAKTCTVCGYVTETMPHMFPANPTSVVKPSCTVPGKNIYVCMDNCGYQREDAVPVVPHTPSGDWSKDTATHWHACTVCSEKLTNAAHSCATSAFTTNTTSHWQVCDTCRGEFNKAAHADADSSGSCDRCGYAMAVNGFTVTFRNGSGNYSIQTVVKGKTPNNPGTPSKSSGYSFRGWATSDPGSAATYRGQSYLSAAQVTSTAITSNIAYYALYTANVSGQDVSVVLDNTEGLGANASTDSSSSLRSQMNSRFTTATGGGLRYVRFGSASGSGYGRLYQDSDQTSLSSSRDYYYSSSSYGTYPLSSVYFLPSGSKGTYYISYAGYDEYGNSASGTASFVVGEATSSTTITYTVDPGEEVSFDADDFNDAYQTEYSGNIRYVTFDTASSLTASNGVLYYDYGGKSEHAFSKSTIDDSDFYYSSSSYGDYDLDELSFVASSDFDSTVTLEFRAYYSASKYVDGTVEIESGHSGSSGTQIVYTVEPGEEVDFDAEDFNRVYQEDYSGNIRYVTFDTASTLVSSNGVLYYDYDGRNEKAFSKSTIDDSNFYYSSSSYGDYDLDELTFVASEDFDSTVTLEFRAYYSASKYVDGTVEIRSGSETSEGDIAYTVKPGGELNFDAEDFNEVYQQDYSGDVRYVIFDTASSLTSSNGVLYSKYDSKNEKTFSKTTIDDYKFYYDNDSYGDYDLDDLTFVANKDFDATVTLKFRAYYSESKHVDGTLTIQSTDSAAAAGGDILYRTAYSDNVQINPNDIARFFNKSYPGEALKYVKLGGVPTGGNLYYNYYSSSKYGTSSSLKLTASNCDSQSLYFSPTTSQYALSELTYVPSGVNYCARIPFTAYGSSSHSVSGAVLISVNVTAVADVYGVVPKSTSVTLPASAIYSAVAASTGTTLSSIQLVSLPASAAGTLYVGAGTSVKANVTTKYGYSTGTARMSQLCFIPAKNFTGSVEIPYIAYNASGNAIASGKFCLGVVAAVGKYSDMTASTWCYKYVVELSDAKVISGYKDKSFRPNGNVTYGEALKLILLATGTPVQAPTGKHWASGYLTRAKANNLISGNVNLDAPITRLAVSQLAAKAMKLSTSGLSSVKPFTDTNDLYVQALNSAGIVEGYFSKGTSTFKPGSSLTRGQISAIVWRIERA